MIIQLNKIEHFLKAFKAKEESLLEFKIQHELPVQISFLKEFQLKEIRALKLIENDAPKFNLFNILHINHLEAKVHTPFLAELLNPNGSHRQGRLFFDAFMKHLFPTSFIEENISSISIKKETSTYENGRMDILISYQEGKDLKEIVIENKIYHHDEKEQLTKYHRYLTQIRRLKDGAYHLIYLTPYKSKPTKESITVELYNELIMKKALTEWGYYEDIDEILGKVMEHIKAPVVAQTVRQYIEAIQFL